MSEMKTAAEMAVEVKAAFERQTDAVKELAEKALSEARAGKDIGEQMKARADEALITMNETKSRLDDLEQKLARAPTALPSRTKSVGETVLDDEKFKAWLSSEPSSGRADVRVKADLSSLTTDAPGSVGDAVRPSRLPGILPLPERRLLVRDLLTPGQMDGNSIEYVKETGFTNNAAMVGEGQAKPQSDIKLDLVTTSAKVVAHWFKASKQILSDVSQLRSTIDQRLLYGVKLREEAQLLNGDGTGQNLLGLIPQASAYTPAFAPTAPSPIDMMRLAMLQSVLAQYPATGHVLNPVDWARIELTKDSTGRYIIGNPQGSTAPTLWRLPVVETPAIAVDKFLTGAFKLGAQIFDRWEFRVEVGYVNDDFTRNMVTILGEERLALAVYRPEAFIYGDFGFVT